MEQVHVDDGALLIGNGVRLEGNVSAPGRLEVYGQVQGEVVADQLLIGESGFVTGRMVARIIDVSGGAGESITASEAIRIRSTALVSGQVHYNSIEIEAGAQVRGKVEKIRPRPEEAIPPAPTFEPG